MILYQDVILHFLKTAYFGNIDDYYIAQRVKTLTAIELDPEIAAVGEYNFSFLARLTTMLCNYSKNAP